MMSKNIVCVIVFVVSGFGVASLSASAPELQQSESYLSAAQNSLVEVFPQNVDPEHDNCHIILVPVPRNRKERRALLHLPKALQTSLDAQALLREELNFINEFDVRDDAKLARCAFGIVFYGKDVLAHAAGFFLTSSAVKMHSVVLGILLNSQSQAYFLPDGRGGHHLELGLGGVSLIFDHPDHVAEIVPTTVVESERVRPIDVHVGVVTTADGMQRVYVELRKEA